MKIRNLYLVLLLAIATTGCNGGAKHFIADANYRKQVEADLNEKVAAIGCDSIMTWIDNTELSLAEREAMKFFYAYMPLGDISDYSPDYYLQNIRASFTAKSEMAWGNSIPDELFRHFVLPIRVNNENLDSSRVVFYRELKDRVKDLSLYDAILEVNHWCHEKVTYQPSDARTSSPLASIKTAHGRCGEESTFTVAALRAMGIPARQVYTPRWAHTNDNHAWVEAWADGKWYYLGACEPSPVLDMGWFDAPVKRALLLHTKVFGRYGGPEDIMEQTRCFAEINVTSNYAPVAKTTVQVVDADGKALPDADIQFGIYNYADFFPVLSTKTDADGKASITTGKGDLSVWAAKDGMMALEIVSAGKQDEYKVALEFGKGDTFIKELDIVPPVEIKPESKVTPEQIDLNNERLAQEDSIRAAYEATFISRLDAVAFAEQIKADTLQTARLLTASRGNWREIKSFIEQAAKNNKTDLALRLLDAISAKDLRDTPAAVLADHLYNTADHTSELDNNTFDRYVLNPRVSTELLTPYRSWLQQHIPQQAQANAETIMEWVASINLLDEYNPQRIRISPAGVVRLGVADEGSRNILFVAACRSMGIAARLEEVTGKLQYFAGGQWVDVDFGNSSAPVAAEYGSLSLNYTPAPTLDNPQYDTHFTIQRIDNGRLNLLNFRTMRGAEGSMSVRTLFSGSVPIEAGHYMLITGTRMASGKVLARATAFNVEADKTTAVDLVMREDNHDIQVIGSMDAESLFLPKDSDAPQSILTTTGRGYFVVAILGAGQEPTNHFVRDVAKLKSQFEQWDRQMIMLFPNQSQLQRFDAAAFPPLPENITFGVDQNLAIANQLVEALNLQPATSLPIVVIADTFGRIVYSSQGYRIGTGDELMQVIGKL